MTFDGFMTDYRVSTLFVCAITYDRHRQADVFAFVCVCTCARVHIVPHDRMLQTQSNAVHISALKFVEICCNRHCYCSYFTPIDGASCLFSSYNDDFDEEIFHQRYIFPGIIANFGSTTSKH